MMKGSLSWQLHLVKKENRSSFHVHAQERFRNLYTHYGHILQTSGRERKSKLIVASRQIIVASKQIMMGYLLSFLAPILVSKLPQACYTDGVKLQFPCYKTCSTWEDSVTQLVYSASGSILTWIWRAVIPVDLTVDPCVAIQAWTHVWVELVLRKTTWSVENTHTYWHKERFRESIYSFTLSCRGTHLYGGLRN